MNQSSAGKIGRNQPCPCGSGKKFKSCCADKATAPGLGQRPDLQSMLQFAQQAVSQGNFTEAEHWFRQLHTAKPADVFILAGLGQALCWLSRRREGLAYLLKAGKILERNAAKNRDPKFIVDLSAQLLHWGEIAAAERLARMAVSLAPDAANVLNNLALCLTRVNRNAEALPISRRVCELLPDHPGCNILLALIESRTGQTEQALQRLTTVIERNAEAAQTARAHLEMGVMLDKQCRYEEAFTALNHAARTHSLLLNQHPADRELLFNQLQVHSQGFDRDLLQRWSYANLSDDGLPAPAFLMGFLRSGTTLTEQVLGAHPQIIATDESTIIHELTLELQKISGVFDNHAAALNALQLGQIKHLRQFYWKRMREEYGDEVMRKQLVDKHAMNTMDLGVISVVFPEAKILFALRDPRDICISCFMQAFSPAPATVNLLTWRGIAKQYAAVMDYWLKLRPLIQPAYLELRYEDTVADFEASYRRVFEFLGVAWLPEASRFHERAQGRYISTPSFAAVSQPVYKTAVARWKHYQRHFDEILPELERFIGAFGYADTAA